MKKSAKAGEVAPTAQLSGSSLRSLVVIMLLALAGCAIAPTVQPVTVPQIVEMSQAGMAAEQIIAKIRDSGTVYRLKASQLAELKAKGVPNPVIDYMQQTYIDAVRQEQAMADWNRWTPDDFGYWYGGCPYRWGPRWCP